MKQVFRRYSHFFFLLSLFLLSELIVNPIGNFPLNDDWSYGKAVFYTLTQDYTIGGFGAMTLFTHMLWGISFVKIFGFSFTTLRFSTLVSVLIGMFFLEKLVFKITQNKQTAFFACLVLLFNPLYFNLANTFMTDVNFNTLLTIACYCANAFFQSKRYLHFVLFFICCIFLVLLRQYGIILPACFTLACLALKEKRWLATVLSFSGTVIVYLILKRYEEFLSSILPGMSPYKFSGDIHLADPVFQQTFLGYVAARYKILLLHIFIYTSPFALLFLPGLLKRSRLVSALPAFLISGLITYWLCMGTDFPFMNIFVNMNLGPETFYRCTPSHTYSETFALVAGILKFAFTGLSLLVLSLYVLSLRKDSVKKLKPELLFLLAFLPAYAFMLLITESYFDRYHIPFLTVTIVLLAFMNKNSTINYKAALLPLLCFFYVSVFGTKDYLQLNRLRWEAYAFLKETKGLTAEQVNGGFELNCYNDLKDNWWYDYQNLNNFNYLIQFNNEEGFRVLKEYPFQRYFPYKKDKIAIYERIKPK